MTDLPKIPVVMQNKRAMSGCRCHGRMKSEVSDSPQYERYSDIWHLLFMCLLCIHPLDSFWHDLLPWNKFPLKFYHSALTL